MRVLGILNLSHDSFSDGGRFDTLPRALAHAEQLMADGAWGVDVGAVSSNPDGADCSPQEELARLRPVLEGLRERGIPTSVDTFSPQVQRALAPSVDLLNDIRGFPDPTVWPDLAAATCDLVVMHAVQGGRADRRAVDPRTIVDRIAAFFDARLQQLTAAGIAEDRLIVDPGMGFFLGEAPESSLAVLRAIPDLKARTGRPVLISVSRKSFLGAILGGRAPLDRDVATVIAELYAVDAGAAWIRTHAPRALADATTTLKHLRGASGPSPSSP